MSAPKYAISGMLLLLLLGNGISLSWNWGLPYPVSDPLRNFPRVFLWAWERPENLKFLDPHETGVALLAKTLILNGNRLLSRPRMQPIELPPGIATVAVVRIETGAGIPDEGVRQEAVRQILDLASRSVAGIQVDFDARVSERAFYRTMLAEIRRQMPAGRKLSITALASWCIYDDWISDLPVDEAVPMMFRLGIGEAKAKQYLAGGSGFRVAKARFSVGISMDEMPVRVPAGRRVYVFNPRPWTRASVDEALRHVREWK